MTDYVLHLTDQPHINDIRVIGDGFNASLIARVPELARLPEINLAIFLRDDQDFIQGGVVGESDRGMMYIDLLWLDDKFRGKGYGEMLMRSIEQASVTHGFRHIFLMTTEFQALPFYRHIGYDLFGTLKNRPHGYEYYYLRKYDVEPDPRNFGLNVTIAPKESDVRAVNRGLRDYCEQFVDCTSRPLAGFIRENDGTIRGGIYGATYWDWYDLRYLWIHDDLRGQGYVKQLLDMAVEECRQRGITGIVSDIADEESLPFYQSQGFEVFATLPERPPNHTAYFIKRLL